VFPLLRVFDVRSERFHHRYRRSDAVEAVSSGRPVPGTPLAVLRKAHRRSLRPFVELIEEGEVDRMLVRFLGLNSGRIRVSFARIGRSRLFDEDHSTGLDCSGEPRQHRFFVEWYNGRELGPGAFENFEHSLDAGFRMITPTGRMLERGDVITFVRANRGTEDGGFDIEIADVSVRARGADLVAQYKLPEARFSGSAFCRQCGSVMPRVSKERDVVVIAAGSLDTDPPMRSQRHIFTNYKASWFQITDSAPQFAEAPPPG